MEGVKLIVTKTLSSHFQVSTGGHGDLVLQGVATATHGPPPWSPLMCRPRR